MRGNMCILVDYTYFPVKKMYWVRKQSDYDNLAFSLQG